MLSPQLSTTFNEYFNAFSTAFSDKLLPEVLIGGTEHIQSITKSIHTTFTNKSRQQIILYGQQGFGRRSALWKAVDNYETTCKTRLLKVSVNAFLHSSETNILNAIQGQLGQYAMNKLISMSQLRIDVLDEYFSQFSSQFIGMVLLIDHIEVLASVKKQYFLYSLLEWVRESRFPILFAASTSDLMFSEKLEKRVKSRYQHIQYFFFDIPLNFVIDVLTYRFKYLQNKQNEQLIEQYLCLLKTKECNTLLQQILRRGVGLNQVIYLFRISFNMVLVHFEQSEDNLQLLHTLYVTESLLFPNIKLELTKSLNQPEYMILFTLFSLIMQQKPQILFNDILQTITRKKQEFTLQKYNIVSNFTPQIYNKALDNLIRLNLVALQNQQSRNLESNQIILIVPLDDMKTIIDDTGDRQSDFVMSLADY